MTYRSIICQRELKPCDQSAPHNSQVSEPKLTFFCIQDFRENVKQVAKAIKLVGLPYRTIMLNEGDLHLCKPASDPFWSTAY